jgi:hypothetical protein
MRLTGVIGTLLSMPARWVMGAIDTDVRTFPDREVVT